MVGRRRSRSAPVEGRRSRPGRATVRGRTSGGAEPRWLDEHEQRAWRAFVRATRLLFDRLDRELQAQAGIPHGYYEILARLSEAPGRTLRMSELAQRDCSSRSRLSHAVARLEEAGWVTRAPSPTDRRGALATLTHQGFRFLQAAAPGHVESVRRHLFDQLSREQVTQLGAISETVVDHLARAAGDDRPAGSCAEDSCAEDS